MHTGLHIKYPLLLEILLEQIFSKDFRKIFKYRISLNRSRGRRVLPFRRTDERTGWHDEANSRFSQFYEQS